MKCPKCGYERQQRDDAFVPVTECPACGIVYSKHDHIKVSESAAAPTPHLKSSPVDPVSLKKARERVEKRIRERLGPQSRDKRHAQTLELAKRLTAEQIRRRRDEWEQTHGRTQPQDPSQTTLAPLDQSVKEERLDTDKMPSAPTEQPGFRRQNSDSSRATAADNPAAPATAVDTIEVQPETVNESSESMIPPEPVAVPTFGLDETVAVAEKTCPAEEEAVLLEDIVVQAADECAVESVEEHESAAASVPVPQEAGVMAAEPAIPAAHVAALENRHPSAAPSRSGGLSRFLPFVAWMILAAGVIGAVLSWTTISNVEAGARVPIPDSLSALPLGLLLGFAYLATGVLGFAFFWVSSLISAQLKDIRHLLMLHPASMQSGEE